MTNVQSLSLCANADTVEGHLLVCLEFYITNNINIEEFAGGKFLCKNYSERELPLHRLVYQLQMDSILLYHNLKNQL